MIDLKVLATVPRQSHPVVCYGAERNGDKLRVVYVDRTTKEDDEVDVDPNDVTVIRARYRVSDVGEEAFSRKQLPLAMQDWEFFRMEFGGSNEDCEWSARVALPPGMRTKFMEFMSAMMDEHFAKRKTLERLTEHVRTSGF
jgi:hypothetical protein